jgi:hypothetical protein
VFWVYVGLALWIGLSVPLGLLAGAAMRGRRRVIDITDRRPRLSRLGRERERVTSES